MPASERGGIIAATHLDGVVPDDADIGEAAFGDLLEQAAHTRRMHLDAEEIDRAAARARSSPSSRPCRTRPRARAARGGRTRDRSRAATARTATPNARPQRLERALLRGRHAPAAAARSCVWAGADGRRIGSAGHCAGARTPVRSSGESAREARMRARAPLRVVDRTIVCASFHVATASVQVAAGSPRTAPCARRRA